MAYYPIAIDLTNKECLVVGGGEVALRKVQALLHTGARVTVIAPEVDEELASLDGANLIRRLYQPGDAARYTLVFAATGNRAVNAEVFEEAERAGVLVNVVDDPELCSFIVPSVVRRGDLLISISTSGKSPTLAKRIRRELEQAYGEEYAAFADLLGEMRAKVKSKYPSQAEREAVFSRLVDNGILELLRDGREEEARKKALECI